MFSGKGPSNPRPSRPWLGFSLYHAEMAEQSMTSRARFSLPRLTSIFAGALALALVAGCPAGDHQAKKEAQSKAALEKEKGLDPASAETKPAPPKDLSHLSRNAWAHRRGW